MSRKRIVIIEDSGFIVSVYRAKLQGEGYEIFAGGDGETGLALVREMRPHLVVLDLGLPKMSGVEVLRRIREQADFGQLPVLVLSGAYSGQVVDEALQAGATEILSKSANTPNHVVQRIRAALAA
jgi:DNA-binding response OmpR family regulator